MPGATVRTPVFDGGGFSHTEQLNLESARANPVHGYLFLGRDEHLLLDAARRLFIALNCPNGGCGTCSFCTTSLHESAAIPDFITIYPEGTGIFIDQARNEIIRPAYESPYAARIKFIVVVEAELLNQEASNALLKALEEPPATTVFILIAERESQLLPTVVSRLATMRFGESSESASSRRGDAEVKETVAALYDALLEKAGLLTVEDRLAQLIKKRAEHARASSERMLAALRTMDLDPEYVRWREKNEKRRVERAERRARVDVLRGFIDTTLKLVNEAIMLEGDEAYDLAEDDRTVGLVSELARSVPPARLLELQNVLLEANSMLRIGVSPDQLSHGLVLMIWKVFRG